MVYKFYYDSIIGISVKMGDWYRILNKKERDRLLDLGYNLQNNEEIAEKDITDLLEEWDYYFSEPEKIDLFEKYDDFYECQERVFDVLD